MIKRIFGVIFAVVLLFFVCIVFPPIAASAEESTETTQETTAEPQEPTTEQEPDASGETPQDPTDEAQDGVMSNIVQDFIAQLKDKYGDQWQQYYDAIIAEWGTVEQYLLSLVPEDAPDVVKDGWTSFVDWTRENWVVLAAIGATVCVIIIIVFGKKIFDAVKKFFLSVFRSTNKQYKVLLAQNNAIFALLGDNPKFEEQRAALKSANEEMMKDE